VPLLDINCKCNRPAVRLFVKKDGPNKGRPFYKCDGSTCDFFKWGDENLPPAGGSGSGGASDVSSTTSRGTGRRKCGICRQEGHTKNKCPQRQDF
jgi:DNA topoisomerase-3